MVLTPSKFSVNHPTTDEEIWVKILSALTPSERKEANKSESDIKEPYPSCKEVIVRKSDKTDIAYTVRNEINKYGYEWAMYREI